MHILDLSTSKSLQLGIILFHLIHLWEFSFQSVEFETAPIRNITTMYTALLLRAIDAFVWLLSLQEITAHMKNNV